MRAAALAFALILSSPAALAAPDPNSFWSDGKAELDGYRTTRNRYGEDRNGTLVLIYVKEPFSEAQRIKADPGHPASDVFDVLKLNVVEDFQTGIYDYNLMSSIFSQFSARAGRRAGAAVKIVFSNQEWCGAVFEELLIDPSAVRQKRFSYFGGEGDQDQKLSLPEGGLFLDEIPILVRQFPSAFLQPGESKKAPIFPQLTHARLIHKPADWAQGTISRGDKPKTIEVPAGKFEVETWTVEAHGDTWTYLVEKTHPHRIILWTGPSAFRAELTGSARLPYWELNQNGGESYLPKIGLPLPQKPAR